MSAWHSHRHAFFGSISIASLVTIAWVFGFLVVEKQSYTMSTLFSIFISLQALFFLVFNLLGHKENRKDFWIALSSQKRSDLVTLTKDKTMAISQQGQRKSSLNSAEQGSRTHYYPAINSSSSEPDVLVMSGMHLKPSTNSLALTHSPETQRQDTEITTTPAKSNTTSITSKVRGSSNAPSILGTEIITQETDFEYGK